MNAAGERISRLYICPTCWRLWGGYWTPRVRHDARYGSQISTPHQTVSPSGWADYYEKTKDWVDPDPRGVDVVKARNQRLWDAVESKGPYSCTGHVVPYKDKASVAAYRLGSSWAELQVMAHAWAAERGWTWGEAKHKRRGKITHVT